MGGSADRYERANTFGGSPLGKVESSGSREVAFNLRATQIDKVQPSHESQREEATPVLGGRVADGPVGGSNKHQEEEKASSVRDEPPSAMEEEEEDAEADRPQEFKFCYLLKM